jgi:hypothetical protein
MSRTAAAKQISSIGILAGSHGQRAASSTTRARSLAGRPHALGSRRHRTPRHAAAEQAVEHCSSLSGVQLLYCDREILPSAVTS